MINGSDRIVRCQNTVSLYTARLTPGVMFLPSGSDHCVHLFLPRPDPIGTRPRRHFEPKQVAGMLNRLRIRTDGSYSQMCSYELTG
jgi:hypothetical protein